VPAPFRVLGYRTPKELKGADPDEPEATLEALLSAKGFARAGGDVARYGRRLALVLARLAAWDSWRGVERVYLGGGIASRAVLEAARAPVDLRLLPGHAGLLGGAHLMPDPAPFVAIDLGGTNVRVARIEAGGIVTGTLHEERHAGAGHTRESLIDRIAELARPHRLRVCLGCPGTLDGTGRIVEGAKNMPGDWSAPEFHLRQALEARIGRDVAIFNDAVVHGAAAWPDLGGVAEWGVLTLGTGLGNARFSRIC
jgi:hypothetical protein